MTLDLHLDFDFDLVTTTATTPPTTADRTPRRALDYAAVVGAWAVVVVAASIFPLDDPQVAKVALFIHLMSMAVGFGSVVMIDAYGLMWLFGHKTLVEVVDLAAVAHTVIALGIGGLLASGIALNPDMSSPLSRFKMLLVLVVMLNGVAAQRLLQRMKKNLPPDTRGDSIPWAGFQRAMTAALISQASWWGAIAIGFITSVNRHS